MLHSLFWFFPSYEPTTEQELRPIDTMRSGIYWTLLLLLFVEFLVFVTGRFADFGTIWKLIYVAAAFFVSGIFFFGGIHTIDVGSKAVPLFLDKRLEKFILTEGMHWLFPKPLMDIAKRDLRKRITPASNTDTTMDKVRVNAEASIEWTISNIFKSLDISESVIEKGLVDLIKNVLRVSIYSTDSSEILGAYEYIRDRLEAAAQAKSDEWGIRIIEVFVSSIDFTSEDVARDHEQKRREQVQAEAEKEEADRARERIKEIRDDLGVSAEKAIEFFQTERKKVGKEIKEYKISGVSEQITNAIAKKVLGDGGNQ